MSQIRIDYLPLSELRGADLNPKMHAGAVLDESIERFGYVQPMTINEATGQLVAGHGRLEALSRRKAAGKPPPGRVDLRADGEWLVPVVRGISFASEEEALAYLVADNRTSEIGGWDYGAADRVLQEIVHDLAGLGFTEADRRDLNAKAEIIARTSAIPPDEATSAQVPILENPMGEEDADSRPGEIYELGPHRLICGDCRNPEHWDKLLRDDDAQVVVTSPPYAQQREYDGKSGFVPIPQDKYVDWWKALNDLLVRYLEPDGCFFLNIKEHCEDYQRVLYVNDLVAAHVRQWGWYWVDTFAWTHGGTPRRVDNRFKNAWEPIYQFTRLPKAKQRDGDPPGFKFRPEYVRKRNGPDIRGGYMKVEPESLWQGGHPNDEDKQGDTEAMERHVLEASGRRAKSGGEIPHSSNAQLQGKPGGGAEIRNRVRAGSRASIPNPRLDTQQGLPDAGYLLTARIEEVMEGGWAYPSNVLSLGRNREALGHAAAFPVALPAFFIRAYSEPGDLIVDPFLGSGSTLIAAEDNKRVCYGFEISPKYCDLIRKRYESYIKPAREGEGKQTSMLLPPPPPEEAP